MLGKKVLTDAGEAIVLEQKEDYLILYRIDGDEFVKANNYEIRDGKLVWGHGNYYNNLSDLIQGL